MTPGQTERIKLRANALDRASTALVTLGVLAPVAAAIYAPAQHGSDWWVYAISVPAWILAAYGLHWFAGYLLRDLDGDTP